MLLASFESQFLVHFECTFSFVCLVLPVPCIENISLSLLLVFVCFTKVINYFLQTFVKQEKQNEGSHPLLQTGNNQVTFFEKHA